MSAQPNYNRMPGYGDLPGDSTNPNSPDYVEPDFSEWEAMRNVAGRIHLDDLAKILGDLADAALLLEVLNLTDLAKHAKRLDQGRDREYRILNGEAA